MPPQQKSWLRQLIRHTCSYYILLFLWCSHALLQPVLLLIVVPPSISQRSHRSLVCSPRIDQSLSSLLFTQMTLRPTLPVSPYKTFALSPITNSYVVSWVVRIPICTICRLSVTSVIKVYLSYPPGVLVYISFFLLPVFPISSTTYKLSCKFMTVLTLHVHTLLCAYFIVCSFYTMLCILLHWCVISSCCCCC